uniref:von Hippel-Lindau disease tumour suppressor beta domain-containing protein n=1 Tax=Dunaliella tertiolecta TaxID=3047 RepID=A0A7S3R0P4_DUNTE
MNAMKTAKPLQTMSGVHKLSPHEDVGFYKGKKSKRTFHIFVNTLEEPVDLYYFYDGGETLRGSIEPGSNLYVGTYIFHQWKVKRRGDGALLGLYAGQSAIVTIHKRGCSATYNAGTVDWRDVGDANCTSLSTPFGPYALRTSVHGMEIWALQCVSDAAVERLKELVDCMLESCPVGVLQRMLKHHPSFGIFGRDNVVSGECGYSAACLCSCARWSPWIRSCKARATHDLRFQIAIYDLRSI